MGYSEQEVSKTCQEHVRNAAPIDVTCRAWDINVGHYICEESNVVGNVSGTCQEHVRNISGTLYWTLKSEVVGNMSGTLYRLMSRVERGTSMHQCRSLYMFNAAAFSTFFGPITMPGASVGGALVGIIDKFALC